MRKDPRTSLAEWEYEEHKIRMRTLKVTHECEEERLKKIRLEIKHNEEEHQEKMRIIKLQLASSGQQCVIIQEVDENTNEQ
jgi:hypothetical protein